MQQERRQYIRWPVRQPVQYQSKESEQECISKDLGPKGICLQLNEELSSETPVRLDISLLQQGRMSATGKVVWQKKSEDSTDKYIAGVQFITISDSDKDKIFKFMFANHREKIIQSWWRGLDGDSEK